MAKTGIIVYKFSSFLQYADHSGAREAEKLYILRFGHYILILVKTFGKNLFLNIHIFPHLHGNVKKKSTSSLGSELCPISNRHELFWAITAAMA